MDEFESKVDSKVWKKIVDKSLVGIYILDEMGKIVYVNEIVERATKYKKEELYAMENVYLLMVDPILESIFQFQDMSFYEARYRRKDGKIRWIWGFMAPLEIEGKSYLLGNWIDVTRMKRLESELRNRIEYMSLLNSLLRHDIGNALTVISAAFELENERIKLLAKEKVDFIEKLIKITRDLEVAVGELKPVNLAEVMKEVAKQYENIEVNVGDVFVNANDAIYVVLNNVIQNAFIHGGENVKVTADSFEEENWIVLRISDNGVGVPDEIKDKIFERGFTTGGGSGFGLFIAKWLMALYNGTISVKDNKPRGAVFELRFPKIKQ